MKTKCPQCGKVCELHIYQGKEHPHAIAIHKLEKDKLGLFMNVVESCVFVTKKELETAQFYSGQPKAWMI